MTQKIPGWYDTPGAMEFLDVSRNTISKIAKREDWQSVSMASGNIHLHRAEDVHEYRELQLRTRLVAALGWKGRGKYRGTDIDNSCPVCWAFAIEWPPPPQLATQWLCVKGHGGTFDENGDFVVV